MSISSAPKSLSHPALRPPGFSPLLNGDAARDRSLVSALLSEWDAEGFTQVAPIQVDDAQTLLGDRSLAVQNSAFRFMDPQTGNMLALLPDVTLGIARLAAGELAELPRPLCLSYEGQAIRVAGSATRPTRQFGQVGAEVIGVDALWERRLIALALTSLSNLGFSDLHLSLVLPPLAMEMIDQFDLPAPLAQALDRKDEGMIKDLAGDLAPTFLSLLQGDLTADPALEALRHLRDGLVSDFPHVHVRCEPFEQRGFGFQTGPSFAIYCKGYQGELARGGRYESKGEDCFGFTLYRDALLAAQTS